MEEDIKILEELIAGAKAYGVYEGNKYYKSIENIIARYKELEKHYQHEQEYINGEVFSAKQMHYIEDNYIDKSKVKEKIEELIKQGNYRTKDNPKGRVHFHLEPEDYQIAVLQELLD